MIIQYCREYRRWVIIKDDGEKVWPQHSAHLVQILNTIAALDRLERGDVYYPDGFEEEWVKDYEQWYSNLQGTRPKSPATRSKPSAPNDSISLKDLGL